MTVTQQGLYLQAVYQPFPRWRFGTRIDGLAMDTPDAAFAGTALAAPGMTRGATA